MESLQFYLTIALIWTVAAITPGPNFFITVHTAIDSSLKKSLCTVSGIVAGTCIWSFSGYFGMTVIFQTAPLLYSIMKIMGGLYLIYLGLRLFWKKAPRNSGETRDFTRSPFRCFCQGVFTNLLNPKTAAFMASLFAVAIPPHHTLETGLYSVALICLISALWYAVVASLFSSKKARLGYERHKKWIERTAGSIFIFFGSKLALTK